MCDFSGHLVAWMDGELARDEAAAVEQHVQACAECRERVAAYEEVSRGFAAYYDATLQTAEATQTKTPRKFPRWVPVVAAAAAAAAVLLLVLLPRSVKPIPVVPLVAVTHPPVAVEPATKPLDASSPRPCSSSPESPERRIGRWLIPRSRSPSRRTRCFLPAPCPRESTTSQV